MQKVQGVIFAFLYFNFFSFIIPLRYFLYSAVLKFLSPILLLLNKCFILYYIDILVWMGLRARIGSRYSWYVKSSRRKLGALFKLYLDLSKHTFQYAYLVTTYLLSYD